MAAHVWESKPFHTWTDQELKQVLTDSPWAGKASLTYVRTRPQPIQEEAIVTWASARVMRQALARKEFGPTAELPKDVERIIERTPSMYIVTVTISKGAASDGHAQRAEAMQAETFLQLPGKPPIPAVSAEGEVIGPDGKPLSAPEEPPAVRGRAGSPGSPAVFASAAQRGGGGGGGTRGGSTGGAQRGGDGRNGGRGARGRGAFGGLAGAGSSLMTFRFPRDPITLDDKEVEFVSKLCGGGGGGFPPLLPENPQLNLQGAPQRGGGGGLPGDFGNAPVPAAGQVPACNYNVKKKFKLKDMVVNGELGL
jgi:hypothetical protein